MSNFWQTATIWMIQSMIAGGAALLVAWLALRRTSDPARRQKIAGWSLRAAVAACVLALLPAWWTINVAVWTQPVEVSAEVAPSLVATEIQQELPMEFVWVPVAEEPQPLAALPAETTPSRVSEPAPQPVATESPGNGFAEFAPILLAPYGCAVVFLLLRQIVGHIGLARLSRSAKVASPEVRILARSLTNKPMPRILVTERLFTPVCYGIFRPTILLPSSLLKATNPEQLRWVLAHELDHIQRGDTRTGLWLGLAQAIYFVLPWFWSVRRELNLAQEYLADQAAAGSQHADYAAFLVELTSGPGVPRSLRALPSLAGVRAGQSDLYRRVTMLLQPKSDRKSRWGTAWSSLAIATAVGTAVGLSGLRLTADEKPKEKKVVVVVRDDDERGDAKGDAKKDAKPKPETADIQVEVKRDGGKTDTRELEKAIADAKAKGNVEQANKLTEKLNAVVARAKLEGEKAQSRNITTTTNDTEVPNEIKAYEKAIQSLKQALAEVNDQPEAKAALEKSIAAYREKIAEAKKKGELKLAEKPQPAPNSWIAPRGVAQVQFAGQAERFAELEKKLSALRDKMQKQMADMNNDPKQADAFKALLKEHEANLDEIRKTIEQLTPRLLEMPAQIQGFPQGGQWQMQSFTVPNGRGGFQTRTATVPAIGAKAGGQGRLGITIDSVPAVLADQFDLAKGQGVLITGVVEGSLAAKSGFKTNDVLLTIGGETANSENATGLIAGIQAKQPTDFVVLRKGKKETIKGVTFPEMKREADAGASSSSVSVSVTDEDFTISSQENKTKIEITGKISNKSSSKVTVSQGESKKEYASVKEVPAELRPKVEKLLTFVSGQ